jgi:hypothetical protein
VQPQRQVSEGTTSSAQGVRRSCAGSSRSAQHILRSKFCSWSARISSVPRRIREARDGARPDGFGVADAGGAALPAVCMSSGWWFTPATADDRSAAATARSCTRRFSSVPSAQRMGQHNTAAPSCRHDWKICPYAHPGEVARRRHPRGYTAVLCPAKTAVRAAITHISAEQLQPVSSCCSMSARILDLRTLSNNCRAAASGYGVQQLLSHMLRCTSVMLLLLLDLQRPTMTRAVVCCLCPCAGVVSAPGAVHVCTQPM